MSPADLDALLPALLELGCEPPFVTLDELGRRRVPSEFGDFRGHVAYAPGDDLRFLDWRVLARTGDRMLKRFDGVEHRRLVLHVDGSASCATRGEGLRELAQLWTLLGLWTLDSIEVFWHGGAGLAQARFEGPGELQRAKDFFAARGFDGELREAALGELLAQSPGGGAVLVSDFMPSEFWRSVLARAAGPGRSLLCVFPRLPLERGLAPAGGFRGMRRFVDPERGHGLTAETGKKLLRVFADEQRQWEEEMAASCRAQRHAFVAADLPQGDERLQAQSWLPFLVLARGSGRGGRR